MKRPRQLIVSKRDGSLERFSLSKLQNCLAAVMQTQGYDPRLGGPLAKAVAMHLEEWHDAAPPTTAYIYRCICSVLEQTGLGDVSASLADHRAARRQKRQQLRVVPDGDPGATGETWRKTALVSTLEADFGLRHAVARLVAGRVEEQLFALGYRVVSRALVRELLRNELLAWGLADEGVLRRCNAAPVVPSHAPENERP